MKCPKCASTNIGREESSSILNFILGFAAGLPLSIINPAFISLAFSLGLVYYLCKIPFKEVYYRCEDCGYEWKE